MKILIDASNIKRGGGFSHLVNILNYFDAKKYKIEKIFILAEKSVFEKIKQKPVFEKIKQKPVFEKIEKIKQKSVFEHIQSPSNIFKKFFYTLFFIPRKIKKERCDLLFIPSPSLYFKKIVPTVIMFRNLLPFDDEKKKVYGFGLKRLRLFILKHCHILNFKKADGIIFLNEYAKEKIKNFLPISIKTKTVPHGVPDFFFFKNRIHKESGKFKLLYVSHITSYKNHKPLIEAIKVLKDDGFSLSLHLVGDISFKKTFIEMQKVIKKNDLVEDVFYEGEVSYFKIIDWYKNSDIFVFVSSLENMPNILLEAMASKLPIVCSDVRPMTDILENSGEFCNPEDYRSIAFALKKVILDSNLRKNMAENNFQIAQKYSFKRCSFDTMSFLESFAKAS